MKKLYTVTDLGPGDGGKGGVIDKICQITGAHTVIKTGGAQGSHGVRTSCGKNFNFSQFGCGTFRGAKTHVTELMVIEPFYLIEEGQKLQKDFGIGNIFSLITIDENAICSTPFHAIASQLRELDRGKNQKGTVGLGVGEAKRDADLHPELAIYAKDLDSSNLYNKLKKIREYKQTELKDIVNRAQSLTEADQKIAEKNIKMLNDPLLISRIVSWYRGLAKSVKIVGREYLEDLLKKDGIIAAESSHGILTDRYFGFAPHTSYLRTTPEQIWKMITDYQYDGQIIKLGTCRAYQIRHGAGPIVTESDEYEKLMLPHSSKEENRWQGKVRIGPLDLVTMEYAINACGGENYFDGLAINWIDQIQKIGFWDVCHRYENANPEFFSSNGEHLLISKLPTEIQLKRQERLTISLSQSWPEITRYDLKGMSRQEIIKLISKVFKDRLELPLKMASFGPTEVDKICL